MGVVGRIRTGRVGNGAAIDERGGIHAADQAHRRRRRRRPLFALRAAQIALCASGRQRIPALAAVPRSRRGSPGCPCALRFLRAILGLLAICQFGSCARSSSAASASTRAARTLFWVSQSLSSCARSDYSQAPHTPALRYSYNLR